MNIEKILENHFLWLLGNTLGMKAHLVRANLQEAVLRWANLQEADLREADLREADLRWANLQDAVWGGLHFPRTQSNRTTNYYESKVFCGGFIGTLTEFKSLVAKKQDGCERNAYLAIIAKIENS